ncbi:DUF1906 domain-containing protein [Streptomyces armeniacus]|uniref:DUF1906 domain-containing protein n=1 Tax=Streptomyces armeniacus TaxID=83291 RepID=A0A345XTA9_9ACTN|nr:DUF1906 domain-containing protein [Streptomyces armeniacus]
MGAAASAGAVPEGTADGGAGPGDTRQVSHRGYDVTVPASWRVVDLAERPSACILFDTPTVYVGPAGSQQDCPAHAVGGAPSVWIRALDGTEPPAGARVLGKGAAASVAPDEDGESHVVVRGAGVLVSSFGGDKAADVLESAKLTADARPADGRSEAGGTAADTAGDTAGDVDASAAVEAPGTFRGRGFDACTAPGGKAMSAWRKTTNFRSVGIYIGGISRACAQPKLTADWVRHRVAGGWHPLPIYVGPQAPCEADRFAHTMSSDASTARGQGRRAAGAAVNKAKSLAIGPRSVLYYDIEGYNNDNSTCRRAVLSFLSGWTNQLHRAGYRSGVYSSISSGISDLSDTYRSDKFARPNHIWAAWWNGERNTAFRPYVPDGQWDNRQRVHQYRGGHSETHGGHTINIDSNYMSVH